MMLVLADPGLGKSLLIQVFLDRLGGDVDPVLITNTHFHDLQSLLQAILFDLALPHEGRSQQEMRLALTDYFLVQLGKGQRTILVIDEAHHLSPEHLEELRLLGNLEGSGGKAVQVVLFGLATMQDALSSPELEAFRQRLAVRLHLEALSVEEAADYLMYQVRVAGGAPENLFAPETAEVLARGCRGVPRLLNQAARQALRLTQQAGNTTLDVEAALEALSLLGLEAEESSSILFNEEVLNEEESSSEPDQTTVLPMHTGEDLPPTQSA
jgi:general secretion pathway protein A